MRDEMEIRKIKTNMCEYDLAPCDCGDCNTPLTTDLFQLTFVYDHGEANQRRSHWDNVCGVCVKKHAPGALIDNGTRAHMQDNHS